jgi:DNA-binding LacI/PurR family transcriptional regulator
VGGFVVALIKSHSENKLIPSEILLCNRLQSYIYRVAIDCNDVYIESIHEMMKLEDIAKLAGVSHSTVSRALAGSTLVNRATRERIVAIADDHGYQVNQVARNLKLQHTNTIGLIAPELSNPYYPKLIQSIADSVSESGYSLQLHLSGTNQENEEKSLINLRNNRVDGILLITGEHGLMASEHAAGLQKSGIPLVVMGWFPGADAFDFITGDDADGARQIARHLLELGHQSIAVIGKPVHRGPFDRPMAFINEVEQGGVQIDAGNRYEVSSELDVLLAVKQLLQTEPRPTAVFAYQDSIALIVCKELHVSGLRVPEDISVIGFDDLDMAAYVSPALTTVGCHIEAMAQAFVHRLTERITGETAATKTVGIVIPTRLITRESSGPAKDISR